MHGSSFKSINGFKWSRKASKHNSPETNGINRCQGHMRIAAERSMICWTILALQREKKIWMTLQDRRKRSEGLTRNVLHAKNEAALNWRHQMPQLCFETYTLCLKTQQNMNAYAFQNPSWRPTLGWNGEGTMSQNIVLNS